MQAKRPVIGLALGSGAARGWAHIGVIRALEDAGIRPQMVTGCSIGTMVAAAYASESLDEFEEWVRGITSWHVMQLLDVRFSGGLIEGDSLMHSLAKLMREKDIEDLSMPFAAVATDLEAGREVWVRKGKLLDAVRASIAVPGLMAPVRQDGRWLVDGGLTDPVPISLCRALGADVVIAVNLNSDLIGRHLRSIKGAARHDTDGENALRQWFGSIDERLLNGRIGKWLGGQEEEEAPGMMDVMAGSLDIMQDRITRSRMAGDPPEVLISPRLSRIGLLEFERAEESIKAGYEAARKAIEDSEILPKSDLNDDEADRR